MSVNGSSKSSKKSFITKIVSSVKKNNEGNNVNNSDYDTSSLGSNESDTSTLQIATPSVPLEAQTSKTGTPPSGSKSLKKKFFRNFSSVETDEDIIDRYSCALLNEILLHGRLYITTNYFAFYSNVFGYVTKILIPIISVENITKEKTAKIIPNAIGITTSDKKYVFGSFISRDSVLEKMTAIWQKVKNETEIIEFDSEIDEEEEEEEANSSEFIDGEENHTEVDSSNHKTENPKQFHNKRSRSSKVLVIVRQKLRRHSLVFISTTLLLIILYLSAGLLLYKVYKIQNRYSHALKDITNSDSETLYSDMLQLQAELHSKSDDAVYNFLDANLGQIAKVKKSLETLSSLLALNSSPPVNNMDQNVPKDVG